MRIYKVFEKLEQNKDNQFEILYKNEQNIIVYNLFNKVNQLCIFIKI